MKPGSLPIPVFRKTKKVIIINTRDGFDHYMMFVIAPDHNSGKKDSYSLIKIMCHSGKSQCCGRELPYDYCLNLVNKLIPKTLKDAIAK